MEQGQHPKCFAAGLLLVLALGIYAAHVAFFPVMPLCIVLGILFLLSTFLAWRSSRWTFLSFLLLFFVLGIVRGAMGFSLPANDISHIPGSDVKVRGILREAPQESMNGRGEARSRYRIEVTEVKRPRDEDWQTASGGLRIYAQGAAKEAQIGDRVTASGNLRLPHSYRNEGQIDTVLLLRADGITASLMAKASQVKIESRDAGWRDAVLRIGTRLRAHYFETMQKSMARPDAAALFAMLFGGYDGIKESLVDSFVTTGLVHILSVSGSHVSLLAATIAWLGLLLRLPRPLTAGLVLLAVAFYVILAGCVPPAVRSGVMGGLAFIALAIDREHEGQYIMLLTGMLMLATSPLLLFHISFQLSFAATAGLLFLAPVFRTWMKAHGLPDFAAAGLSITLAAQLATLPLLAYYFGRVSLVAFLANLILVPPVELLIVIALFGGMAALALPILGQLVFALLGLLLGFVYELARKLSGMPLAMVGVSAMGAGKTACYYLALSFLLFPNCLRNRLREYASLFHRREVCVIASVSLLLLLLHAVLAPKTMEVHFLDVHQGDACLIKTPHGHAFFIDTGGTRDGAYDVGKQIDVPYLRRNGIRSLDAIFLSHAHEDHAAGAGGILRELPVYHVYTASEGRNVYAKSMGMSIADPLLDTLTPLCTGERFAIDGVMVDVLFAPAAAQMNGSGNEACDVLRVSYGDVSILFTGDMEEPEEHDLLAHGIDPASTVLKVGHHGAATSTSGAFLRAVAPKLAVISVGADNTYGHPAPAVLARLEAQGASVLRTDEQGAVILTTDGKGVQAKTYIGATVP